MAKTAVVLTFPWTEGDVTHRQGSTVKVNPALAKTLVRNGRANWPTEPSPRTRRRRRAAQRNTDSPEQQDSTGEDAPPADEVADDQAHNTTAQEPAS